MVSIGNRRGRKLELGGAPRVNLLPREVSERRAQSRVFTGWGIRILGAVVLVGLVCAGLFAWQTATDARLGAVQSDGQTLLAQIAAKGEIQQLVSDEEALTEYRMQAMATDLDWAAVLTRIRKQLPKGASLCAYELFSGAAPSGVAEEQVGLSGAIRVCGPFPSAIPFLEDIESADGVTVATVREGEYDGELKTYVHTIELELDQTIYSGDYDEEAGR